MAITFIKHIHYAIKRMKTVKFNKLNWHIYLKSNFRWVGNYYQRHEELYIWSIHPANNNNNEKYATFDFFAVNLVFDTLRFCYFCWRPCRWWNCFTFVIWDTKFIPCYIVTSIFVIFDTVLLITFTDYWLLTNYLK